MTTDRATTTGPSASERSADLDATMISTARAFVAPARRIVDGGVR